MDDVFHWRDHKAHGTTAHVKAQLKAGRWKRVCARVIAKTNGTLSPRSRRRAALLYADGRERDRAFLSHWTAAQMHNFGLPASELVHVSATAAVNDVEGLLVAHITRNVAERDVMMLDGVRVGTPARTLVDLAPELSERELRYLVGRLVQRTQVARGYLAEAIERVPRHPGTHELRKIIAIVVRGAKSGSEIRLIDGLAQRGWHCEPNGILALPGGGWREGDLLFRAVRAVVQVESVEHHTLDPDRESDAERDIDFVGAGYVTIPAWTRRIESDLDATLDRIVGALEARAQELGVPLEVARAA